MKDQMTVRERWVAALDMKPVDRIPFWPKIDGGFVKNQPAPYSAMNPMEICRELRTDPLTGFWPFIKESHTRCSTENRNEDGLSVSIMQTPVGSLRSSSKFDPISGAPYPVEHPVKTLEDIKIMTAFCADTKVELNEEALNNSRQQTAKVTDACVNIGVGTSPLMQWLQYTAGVETGQMLLMEHPDEVAELFEVMHQGVLRKMGILAENDPTDFVLLVENTSTTLFSPRQYRDWNYRHMMDYARVMHDGGKRLVLHMCGHLKAILPDLETLPVCGFEAFTSPKVGNATLVDGRSQCPTKCLIGGTNAALWTRSADEIIRELEEHLTALPHHRGIVLSPSGIMPPMCQVETLRKVAQWIREFPVRG